jgi:hypothetical protein
MPRPAPCIAVYCVLIIFPSTFLSLSNVVVTRVIAQIRSRQTDLRRHLLHRLKSHVTMPECLEVVTALRRLNSIDLERQSEVDLEAIHACAELRLQVDFLEARDAWLDSTSAPVANSSSSSRSALLQFGSSEQLLDAIERHRTRYVCEREHEHPRVSRCYVHPLTIRLFVPLLPYAASLKLRRSSMPFFVPKSTNPRRQHPC